MAHIRRKFAEAERACPGVSSKALEYIGLLYTQEENLGQRKASYEEVAKERKEKGLPIMDAMEAWMKVASKTTTPVPELNVAGTRCVSQKKQAALAGAVCLRGVKVTVRRVTS